MFEFKEGQIGGKESYWFLINDDYLKHKKTKMKNPLLKRNKEILQMRQNRYKLREIAEKFGVSKERVRQITSKEI